MHHHRFLALSLLTACALTALPAANARAERVDEALAFGQSTLGEIVRPGDVHTIGFLATAGAKRKLKIQVKRGRKSALQPDVRLLGPDGSEVDVVALGGKLKTNPKSYKVTLNSVPTSGLWRLVIRGGEQSTGLFQAKITAKEGVKLKSTLVVPVGQFLDVPVEVGANAELTVKAAPGKGVGLTPDLLVIDPNGAVVVDAGTTGAVNARSRKLSLKKQQLPHFGTYTLRFSGLDGGGGQIKYSITSKTLKKAGDLPNGEPGASFAVEPGLEAQLNASASTPAAGGGGLAYSWVQVSGPAVELSDATIATPTFQAPDEPASLGFELSVEQGVRFSLSNFLTVEVGSRPIADAGRSRRVDASSVVTLDATGSFDRRGSGLQYAWRQLDGDAVAVQLDDPFSATPSFTAPAQSTLVHLGLVADDGDARSTQDTIVIAVGDASQSVADAGRVQMVPRMATVHLSALASIPPTGELLTFAWEQLAGPPVELSAQDVFAPSFTAPRTPGDLTFRVVVNGDATSADTVTVHVRPTEENAPPQAKGNGPIVSDAATVALSASASSDRDGDAFTAQWNQLAGPGGALAPSGGTAADAAIGADEVYQFGVHLNDGLQYGAPDIVQVTKSTYAGLPLADAGTDLAARPGNPITLDALGSRSTTGQPGLTYTWTQTAGQDWYDVIAQDPGFDATAPRPSFALPIDVSSITPTRTLQFELVVNDGTGDSLADTVTTSFTGIQRNARPAVTAQASTLAPTPGTIVQIDGTAFDRDGDPITVQWTQTSGPAVTLTPSAQTVSPTFTAPATGVVVLSLTADDGFEESIPATLTFDVNETPVAVFTISPRAAQAGRTITVNARNSSDPELSPLTYRWRQLTGTPLVFDTTAERFQFTSTDETIRFELIVNDGVQDSAPLEDAFIAVGPTDAAPTADVASAAYGTTVSLRANPVASGLTFTWRQIREGVNANDPIAPLSSTTAENPTFVAPVPPNTANAGFGSAPVVCYGVIATNGAVSSPERTILIPLHASLNASGPNTVYGIIQSSCLSCHTGGSKFCPVGSGNNAAGYGINSVSNFYNNSVGQSSCGGSGGKVLVPSVTAPGNHSGNSYLMDRLLGLGGQTRMPRSAPSLTDRRLNIIRDWIDQGALNN